MSPYNVHYYFFSSATQAFFFRSRWVFFARIHGEEKMATALGRAVFLGQLISKSFEIGNRAGTP